MCALHVRGSNTARSAGYRLQQFATSLGRWMSSTRTQVCIRVPFTKQVLCAITDFCSLVVLIHSQSIAVWMLIAFLIFTPAFHAPGCRNTRIAEEDRLPGSFPHIPGIINECSASFDLMCKHASILVYKLLSIHLPLSSNVFPFSGELPVAHEG